MSTALHLPRLLLGSVGSLCYSLHMNTASNSKTPSLMLMLMLPLAMVPPETNTPLEVILFKEHLCNSPITIQDIQAENRKDTPMSKAVEGMQTVAQVPSSVSCLGRLHAAPREQLCSVKKRRSHDPHPFCRKSSSL